MCWSGSRWTWVLYAVSSLSKMAGAVASNASTLVVAQPASQFFSRFPDRAVEAAPCLSLIATHTEPAVTHAHIHTLPSSTPRHVVMCRPPTPAEARALLGVKPTATEAELKAAYRQLARQHHPDVAAQQQRQTQPGNGTARLDFARIAEAYEVAQQALARMHASMSRAAHTAGVDHDALQRRAAMFDELRGRHRTEDARRYHSLGLRFAAAARRAFQAAPLAFFAVPMAIGLWVWALPAVEGAAGAASDGYGAREDKVMAWYNPAAKQWQTPAPWLPLYRQNQHTLTMMPSSKVRVLSAVGHRVADPASPPERG